ncbi:hypothetical protein [Streptomyces sp. NBC_01716]|uniref:hypothetical protein n=1 Tax=Streptomyces sp. NBC_01716 TaxID=2975917 RepID=UPI002E355962|nr:hypothetical protein [Streptomyces sp. NBC_01716]
MKSGSHQSLWHILLGIVRYGLRGADKASGDHVHQADFSGATGEGIRRLTVTGAGTSVPFTVTRKPLYPDLGRQAMQYFYFHRMGTPVKAEHLQHAAHAHTALHPGDNSAPCYKNWCGKDSRSGKEQRLDVAGSWADAEGRGDYPDTQNSDDRYAAAAELYLTAEQRADRTARTYRSALTRSAHYGEIAPVDWGRVAAAGTLSLLAVPNGLPAADLARMRTTLRTVADTLVKTQRGEGCPALISGAEAYPWGSATAPTGRPICTTGWPGGCTPRPRTRRAGSPAARTAPSSTTRSPPPAAPPPSPRRGPARRRAPGARRRTPSTGTRRWSGSRPTSSRRRLT